MKLRKLNGAIRGVDGAVKVFISTQDGVLEADFVKSTLIANLKTLYGDDNMVETSLKIDGNVLRHEDGSDFGQIPSVIHDVNGDLIGMHELLSDDGVVRVNNAAGDFVEENLLDDDDLPFPDGDDEDLLADL